MNSINHVHLRGQLEFDPQIKEIPATGRRIGRMRVITNIDVAGKNHRHIHKVICWDHLVDAIKDFTKDQYVDVVGRLSYSKFISTVDNTEQINMEVVALEVTLP